ncbi:MAG TPA: tetratricopeptide repeat protein, partial [Usitatibacteraceae bacterium]|nr:tetratricopeptide repeat protein [Usitatibacteraceae bacterium]
MSLLLDALRRAEEAKRAKQPGKPDSEEAGSLPPSEMPARADAKPSQAPAAASAKSLSIAEESLSVPARAAQKMGNEGGTKAKTPGKGLDFALEDVEPPHAAKPTKSPALPPASAATAATPPAASVVSDSQQRDAVRNMFQAKRTESKAAGNRPGWMLPAIAVGIVAIGGGGWYVWNEVNSISKPLAMAPRPTLPAPPPGLPAPAPGTGQVAAQPSAAAAAAQPAAPPLLPPPAPESVEDVKRQVATAPGLSANERLASEIRAKPPRKEPALSLAPSKGPVAKPLSDDLSSAYAALRSGDTRQAVALYEKVLSGDPQSLDARLGLAAAAMRGGDSELAARHFREALALDPRNDYALA